MSTRTNDEQKVDVRTIQLEAIRDELCRRIEEVEEELGALTERRDWLTDRIKRRGEGEDV